MLRNMSCISSSALRNAVAATLFTGLLIQIAPASADDASEITRLMKQGQHAQALSKADAVLGKRPRDAQIRFLKGVILAEQNKSSEAIAVFNKMTQDFPDLPEPYNNLAVLYAAENQYEKARAALDKAIRTNPAYATAYENLGDVHAKLASQAYDRALQLDSGNSGAKSKLTMVSTLVASTAMANPGTPQSAAPATAAAPTAAPTLVKTMPKPDPVTPPVAASVPVRPELPKVAIAKKPSDAAPLPSQSKLETRPAPPDSTDNGDSKAVLAVVNNWAKAWSERDVKGYLAFYASDFETPRGMTRKAWSDEREARIAGKGRIEVRVEAPKVSIKGDTAVVKFRQSYISDRLKANSRKTLTLAKRSGKWQIQQEQIGG